MQERLVAARDNLGTGKVERRSLMRQLRPLSFRPLYYGGPIVTARDVLFICATDFDRKLGPLDAQTGELLWQGEPRFAGNATASTYMIDGKLCIVIAVSGSRSQGTHTKRHEPPQRSPSAMGKVWCSWGAPGLGVLKRIIVGC
jgi:hypothetical protein